MTKIIVAIDGFSSCGKSSTAKKVSQQLGYSYIDTGAMYRAVTLFLIRSNVEFTDKSAVSEAIKSITLTFKYSKNGHNDIWLNGVNVEAEIRKMYVSEKVSEVSAIVQVREFLVHQQKGMADDGGVVMDGRDIGTVVFPQAELKIFMTADTTIRAKRRQEELNNKGEVIDIEKIKQNLEMRDFQDLNRLESPLTRANDAIFLDNSFVSLDEQVELITNLACERIFRLIRQRTENPEIQAKIQVSK